MKQKNLANRRDANMGARVLALALLLMVCIPLNALAVQFSYLDPGLTQEFVTGPLPTGWGPGFAWNSAGQMLLRGDSTIYEYSSTFDSVYQGTPIQSYTSHAVSGLGWGYGLTNGLDGFLYANTSSGLSRVDTASWTASVLPSSVAGYYGIGTLPDGQIVYSDGSSVYRYDLTSSTNTLIYNSGSFVDQLTVASSGEIFLAVLGSTRIDVISAGGALINTFSTTHPPDGIAFGGGAAFSNNTDGTVTRYDFAGPGFTGAATETVIASGGTYGDFAAVGPDGYFYVSQWGGWVGTGINWDNGVSEPTQAVVRFGPAGTFDPSPGVDPSSVPEPSTILLLGSGLLGIVTLSRKGWLRR